MTGFLKAYNSEPDRARDSGSGNGQGTGLSLCRDNNYEFWTKYFLKLFEGPGENRNRCNLGHREAHRQAAKRGTVTGLRPARASRREGEPQNAHVVYTQIFG